MSLRHKFANGAIAFLMVASTVLLVQPTQAFPLPSDEQQDDIVDEFGAPALLDREPFGTWEKRVEGTTLFFDSETVSDAFPTPPPDGSEVTDGRASFLEPTTDNAVLVLIRDPGTPNDKRARVTNAFTLGEALGQETVEFPMEAPVQDDTRVYGYQATVYARCFTRGDLTGEDLPVFDVPLQLRVFQERLQEDGTWERGSQRNVALGTNSREQQYPIAYTGGITIGDPFNDDGDLLDAGEERLVFVVALASGLVGTQVETFCDIHYDTADSASRVSVIADSARVKTWIENVDGDAVLGVPSASSISSDRRFFSVQHLQTSSLGQPAAQINTDWDCQNFNSNNACQPRPRNERDEFQLWNRDTNTVIFDEGDPRDDLIVLVGSQSGIQTLGATTWLHMYTFRYPSALPDGDYFAELRNQRNRYVSSDYRWQVEGAIFTVGLKGVTMGLIPGENATHTVNPGELTEFRFRLSNVGFDDDIVTVAASAPGGGWTAQVSPGTVSVPGLDEGLFTLTVTPPASAAAGQSRVVTLTATSRFDEVTISPVSVTVTLTNTILHKVEIQSVKDALDVRPGQVNRMGVTVVNQGHARDQFVLSTSVPSDVLGWSIAVTPLSLSVPAQSRGEAVLSITPPPEVDPGTRFPLTVTAKRVGDAATSDSLVTTITVVVQEVLGLTVLNEDVSRTMREIASSVCLDPLDPLCLTGTTVSDGDFDTRALHRVVITNDGDSTDSYSLEVFWDKAATEDEADDPFCNDGFSNSPDADGVPDGWRFLFGDDIAAAFPGPDDPQGDGEFDVDAGTSSAFSGYYVQNDTDDPIVLAPGETTYVYYVIGYLRGDVCPEDAFVESGDDTIDSFDPTETPPVSSDFSPTAALTARVQSINNAGILQTVTMVNEITDQGTFIGTNRYSGGRHDVLIEPDLGEDDTAFAPEDGAATFGLRAVNLGNEHDDLIIEVSEVEPGWTARIVPRQQDNVPSSLACDPVSTDGRQLSCPGMGIYEEVAFDVIATPGGGIRIGDIADIEVTVRSGDVPTVGDVLDLTARLAGSFNFDVTFPPRGNDLRAARGDTVSIPFTIENRGTEGDTYFLSLVEGNLDWNPRFSGPLSTFVPADSVQHMFLTLDVPVDAPLNVKQLFEIRVDSANAPALQPDLFVTAIAPNDLLVTAVRNGEPVSDVVIPERGVPFTVTFEAEDQTGATGNTATFTVDQQTLPGGWIVVPLSIQDAFNIESGDTFATAQATFLVTAPLDALGTSRVPLRVNVTTDHALPLQRHGEVILNLLSTFGLSMEALDGANQTIQPGSDVVYRVRVLNNGLGADTATLQVTAPPAGWQMFFSPDTVSLGPLQSQEVEIRLVAPTTVARGVNITTIVQAISTGDPGKSANLELTTTVGFFDPVIDTLPADLFVAPQETLAHTVEVTNAGTIPDLVQLTPTLLTTGQAAHVTLAADPASVELLPGQTKQVQVSVAAGPDIISDALLTIELGGTSLLDEALPAASTAENFTVRVLRYRSMDIDGDGLKEYAIDRDRNSGNGFEQFRENLVPGGIRSTALDMTQYLSNTARQGLTVQVAQEDGSTVERIALTIDPDGDGRRDHFLDSDGDGLPNIYWDADRGTFDAIDLLRDVDADGVLDYFVDIDGDELLDKVYNLRQGTFTNLLRLDLDGDGLTDYVVDKNGNGVRDNDETVLVTGSGRLVTIVKADVTGNGQLDDVFDEDGDGRPDYFVPAGSTDGIRILLKDANGDGVLDWTYDADGDGRVDSYYDPQTGEVHRIEPAENFAELLKEYWYVFALFVLVTTLFVVLIAVTRK